LELTSRPVAEHIESASVARNPAIEYNRNPQSEGASSVVRYGEREYFWKGYAVDSSGIQEYACQMLD
jgi:hypothetical protein